MEEIAQLDDGIYFRLPEEEYHGQRRMSASACRDMLVSPATFWARSWMNPDRDQVDNDTPAKIAGRAYHVARLEPDRFISTYARLPDPADYGDDLLTTHTAIKEAFKEMGLAQTKAGEGVLAAAYRLRESGWRGEIWHLIEEEARAARDENGQTGLPPKLYDEIVRDMDMLLHNEEVHAFLIDGQSEVTVLWTDDKDVRWKARLDWLALRHITDLKTFDNSSNKLLDKALSDNVQFNRLYIQARLYVMAAEAIRTGLRIAKIQNEEQKALIEAIRASDDPFEFWWVFQEKNGVPNVMARRFRQTLEVHPHYLAQAPDEAGRALLKRKIKNPTKLWRKGELEIEWCRNMYLNGLEIYGEAPWQPLRPVDDIDDESFPPYFFED